MSSKKLKPGTRLLLGGIAGFVGTLAMTTAMRRMHKHLPPPERYPLTPREIVDSTAAQAAVELPDETAKDITTAAHFAYGAASGALLGVANVMAGPVPGGVAGVGVWMASYLGWIPGSGILKPAALHPARRNGLMLVAHVVWGVATAKAMRELIAAREAIFDAGDAKDAPAATRAKINRPAD